jgi:hypothetical protein
MTSVWLVHDFAEWGQSLWRGGVVHGFAGWGQLLWRGGAAGSSLQAQNAKCQTLIF